MLGCSSSPLAPRVVFFLWRRRRRGLFVAAGPMRCVQRRDAHHAPRRAASCHGLILLEREPFGSRHTTLLASPRG